MLEVPICDVLLGCSQSATTPRGIGLVYSKWDIIRAYILVISQADVNFDT